MPSMPGPRISSTTDDFQSAPMPLATAITAYVEQLVRRQRAHIKRELIAIRRAGVPIKIWRDSGLWHASAAGHRVARPDQRDALAQLLAIVADGVES